MTSRRQSGTFPVSSRIVRLNLTWIWSSRRTEFSPTFQWNLEQHFISVAHYHRDCILVRGVPYGYVSGHGHDDDESMLFEWLWWINKFGFSGKWGSCLLFGIKKTKVSSSCLVIQLTSPLLDNVNLMEPWINFLSFSPFYSRPKHANLWATNLKGSFISNSNFFVYRTGPDCANHRAN